MNVDFDTDARQSAPAADSIDHTAIQQAMSRHSERIRRQELQQAVSQLKAYGTLTPEQRKIVDEMARAITDEILSSPESVLDDTAAYDAETIQTAVDLFDPDQ
jgi:glutamyl-tRNA reductase